VPEPAAATAAAAKGKAGGAATKGKTWDDDDDDDDNNDDFYDDGDNGDWGVAPGKKSAKKKGGKAKAPAPAPKPAPAPAVVAKPPVDAAAEKRRQQKLVEKADFASAVELFGGDAAEVKKQFGDVDDDDDRDDDEDDDKGKQKVTAKDAAPKPAAGGAAPAAAPKSWASAAGASAPAAAGGAGDKLSKENPKSEFEFNKYAALVSEHIVRHNESYLFVHLVKQILKASVGERTPDELRELAQFLTAMATEKQKKAKEALDAKNSKKNQAKQAKKKLADGFVDDEFDRVGAEYEDKFDF
jgi:hypothetical protein